MDATPPSVPGRSASDRADRLAAARERRGVSEPSAYERAWRRGGEGERLLGDALNLAADASGEFIAMHDPVFPGDHSNIDHVVIGVYAIDAKNWRGRVWVGHDTIGQHRRPRHKAMRGVREQVAKLRTALDSAGHHEIPVAGILCMVNREAGLSDEVRHIGDVTVGHIQPVIDYVREEGALDDRHRSQVHEALSQSFVVRGGSAGSSRVIRSSMPPPSQGSPVVLNLPRLGQRRRVRPLRTILALLVSSAVLMFAISALRAGVQRTNDAGRYITTSELQALRPSLRRLAVEHAAGRVRGPRVEQTAGAFVLTYRGGRNCRVVLRVSRLPRLLGRAPATAEATGCRGR